MITTSGSYRLIVLCVVTFIAYLCFSVTVVASEELSPEFRVNTYTAMAQWYACVATDSSGNAVFAWQSTQQDGDGFGIYGQRYDSALLPVGSEFPVNTTTIGDQMEPDVAANRDGEFVVVWLGIQGLTGNSYFQRYDSSGVPFGTETMACYCGDEWASIAPQAVLTESGHFESIQGIGYLMGSGQISYRGFNASNVPCFENCRGQVTTDDFAGPAVTGNGKGDFVFVWSDRAGLDPATCADVGQVCGGATNPQVEIFPAFLSAVFDVSMISSGDWLLVWPTYDVDADTSSISARWYDLSATPIGADLVVPSRIFGTVADITVSAQEDGDFLVVWKNNDDITARRYDQTDGAFDDEFQVNNPAYLGFRPAVAGSPDGSFWITWDQDGDVYARHLGPEPVGIDDPRGAVPRLGLAQNHPNPFGKSTEFAYELAAPADVTIRIYNARGMLVTVIPQGHRAIGSHRVTWDGFDSRGNRVSSGTYFYELRAGNLVRAKKMIVLR